MNYVIYIPKVGQKNTLCVGGVCVRACACVMIQQQIGLNVNSRWIWVKGTQVFLCKFEIIFK